MVFNLSILAISAILTIALLRYRLRRRHWHLLNNPDAEAFQRSHALGMVRKQADGTDVQAGKDLRSYANVALRFSLVGRR
jgi:hypothetical protein